MSQTGAPFAPVQEALARLHAGDNASAEQILEKQLAAVPSDPNALHLLGLIRMQQQRFEEAEGLLQRSLSISPSHLPARMNFGRMLAMAGQDSRALSTFQQIAADHPDNGEVRLELGNALQRAERTQDAESNLRVAATRMPRSPQARLALGAVLVDLGRLDEAEEQLTLGLGFTKDAGLRARFHNNLALVQQRRNDNDAALASIAEAQALAPAAYQMLDGLRAQLLQRLNRNEESLAILEQIVAREPENAAAHYGYNSLLYRLGRNDELFRSFDRAPPSRDLLMSKGAMLAKMDRMPEAAAVLTALAAENPYDPDVLVNAGASLSALARHDEAVEHLERALTLSPGNPLVMSHLASSLIGRDEPDRAAQLAQQAMMLEPDNQSHVAMLGVAFRLMDDPRHEDIMGYDSQIQVFDLEPPQGWSDMGAFNQELAAALDRLHPDTREYFDQSLRFGTQTPEKLFGTGQKLVDLLQQRISETVQRYIDNLKVDTAHPFTGRRRASFAYTGSWSSRLKDCGYHIDHIHPEGWISSCYYAAVPDVAQDAAQKQGWIKFGQPSMRQDLAPMRTIQPQPGRLVLFPSFMWHGTIPFHSPATRTTIAFDVIPA